MFVKRKSKKLQENHTQYPCKTPVAPFKKKEKIVPLKKGAQQFAPPPLLLDNAQI